MEQLARLQLVVCINDVLERRCQLDVLERPRRGPKAFCRNRMFRPMWPGESGESLSKFSLHV